MDGNGRWATARAMPRKFGHREGVKTLRKIARQAFDRGVEFVTVYAFSTENRFRPQDEIDGLMDLIRKNFATSFNEFVENGIKVKVLGDKSYFPDDIVEIIDELENKSANNDKGVFNIALNYGARDEIVKATIKAINSGEPITEELISKNLYTANQPDPDIIVRTGGEKRLSNFLLYQSAYSELFFCDTLWPDFSTAELDIIISQFSTRNRRYGKVK
ncbi:MAG: di-trans,poly-cis-decaprenylcistransferase [Clostridia bacterium]|nr:di-trans,poly-cis-decaprenylcistransferase [Clostridia bacterium]